MPGSPQGPPVPADPSHWFTLVNCGSSHCWRRAARRLGTRLRQAQGGRDHSVYGGPTRIVQIGQPGINGMNRSPKTERNRSDHLLQIAGLAEARWARRPTVPTPRLGPRMAGCRDAPPDR